MTALFSFNDNHRVSASDRDHGNVVINPLPMEGRLEAGTHSLKQGVIAGHGINRNVLG